MGTLAAFIQPLLYLVAGEGVWGRGDVRLCTRVHRASSMPREEFKQKVERHLTGHEIGPHEVLYFEVYKSQLPVIEEALETVGLMLGSNKSRGYCLEMICADFLAEAKMGDSQE